MSLVSDYELAREGNERAIAPSLLSHVTQTVLVGRPVLPFQLFLICVLISVGKFVGFFKPFTNMSVRSHSVDSTSESVDGTASPVAASPDGAAKNFPHPPSLFIFCGRPNSLEPIGGQARPGDRSTAQGWDI